jgi:tRNA(fMet)-specific endonuclease VapC
MSLWILDTDHVSLALRGHPLVNALIEQRDLEVATTVITAQELFNGWVVRINDPRLANKLVSLYARFFEMLEFLRRIQILNFDDAANQQYKQLLQLNPSLRKKRLQEDLKIAAIALSTQSIVVTRNRRDFSLVEGLTIEDWTIRSVE